MSVVFKISGGNENSGRPKIREGKSIWNRSKLVIVLYEIYVFTIWVFYAFFIEENVSNTNVVQIKGEFCRVVRVTVGVLVSANKPRKPMASVWLMFVYFQKVRFSTRYM